MQPQTFTAADFLARAPHRPYCSDDLVTGLVVRPLATAAKRRYIQHNPPAHLAFIVFDCDRPGVAIAADDAGLAPPSWVTENRNTRRGHIGYALGCPVITSSAARTAPLRYAAAIEQGYRDALRADAGYAGLITKTPGHVEWATHWGRAEPYTLGELADYLPTLPRVRKRTAEACGLGRNVCLFEDLRRWAYRARLGFDDFDDWQAAVAMHASGINAGFVHPLPLNESLSTAQSVAKWVWRQFNAARFATVQATRGRRGGIASGARRAATALDLTAALANA